MMTTTRAFLISMGATIVACGGSAASGPATPGAAGAPSASPPAAGAATGAEVETAPQASAATPGPQPASSAPAEPPASEASAPATTAPPPPARCPEGMALVPGGEYQRVGSKAPEQLGDMCFDATETTVTDYTTCVEQGKCTTDGLDCSAQSTYGHEDKADHPIVCIEFEQAKAYCAFRGKRLPTVAEWEWAARGGEAGFPYPWGHQEPAEQVCWTGMRRQTETCAVGTFASGQSKDGIFNMGGNVLEFVTSEADEKSPVRIAKGGAWNGGDSALFKNTRIGGFKKEYRCGFLGVRCVQPAQPASSSSSSSSAATASQAPAARSETQPTAVETPAPPQTQPPQNAAGR